MRVKAVLTLTVWYDDAENTREADEVLEAMVDACADRGLMSWDSPMFVDTYEFKITTEETGNPAEDVDPDRKDEWTDKR